MTAKQCFLAACCLALGIFGTVTGQDGSAYFAACIVICALGQPK